MKRREKHTRVLITGAHGLIGNLVYVRLAGRPEVYDVYGGARRIVPSDRIDRGGFQQIPDERLRLADLRDLEAVRRSVEGMDVVVHMAADADGRSGWDSVLSNNIVGTYNVFEACREAGVGRIVFASSNQVVFGYRYDGSAGSLREKGLDEEHPGRSGTDVSPPEADLRTPPVRHNQPTRPLSIYACSKVFGEALGHMYAYRYRMSCICLRLGWVTSDDKVYNRALWCSKRDAVQLVERAIEAPADIRYDVFFGQSGAEDSLVNLEHSRTVLGYIPQDRIEDRL